MKLLAAAIVIAAFIVGGVALYIARQHDDHCKPTAFSQC